MAGKQLLQSSLRRVGNPPKGRLQQCRNFTSTQRNRAGATGSARGQITRQLGSEKTMQSRVKSAKGSDVPNDLGLLPECLIKPERKHLPSWFSSQFKRRLRIEWQAIWQKTRSFAAMVIQSKIQVKKNPITRKRMRENMQMADRYLIARELHRELYTALAKGDRTKISQIACAGLVQSLRTRLDHRKAINGAEEDWSIKYRGWTPTSKKTPWLLQALMPASFKSTKIMADRIATIPIGRDGRLRQTVVKISSVQTLDKHDGTAPKTKKADEYVVIQQMTIDGASDKWMIWGTTHTSTPKEIDEIVFGNKNTTKLSFMDRVATDAAAMNNM